MVLLVSDTNILLDWEEAGRLDVLFALGATIAVPDVLLDEELLNRAEKLTALGLVSKTVGPSGVTRVGVLARTHRKPSRNDLLALALAE